MSVYDNISITNQRIVLAQNLFSTFYLRDKKKKISEFMFCPKYIGLPPLEKQPF